MLNTCWGWGCKYRHTEGSQEVLLFSLLATGSSETVYTVSLEIASSSQLP